LDNIERQYPEIEVHEFLPVLCDLCAAYGASFLIVGTVNNENSPDETDLQIESLSDNIFKFRHFFYRGKDYNVMEIKRSVTNTHYRGVLAVEKNPDTSLLELKPTVKLLSDVTVKNPTPLKIRLFLYEGEEETYPRSELYGLYENIHADKEYLPISQSFNRAVVSLGKVDSLTSSGRKKEWQEIDFELAPETQKHSKFNRFDIFRKGNRPKYIF